MCVVIKQDSFRKWREAFNARKSNEETIIGMDVWVAVECGPKNEDGQRKLCAKHGVVCGETILNTPGMKGTINYECWPYCLLDDLTEVDTFVQRNIYGDEKFVKDYVDDYNSDVFEGV